MITGDKVKQYDQNGHPLQLTIHVVAKIGNMCCLSK